MQYFLTAIISFCLGLSATAEANTIELQIQSHHHERLKRLFDTEKALPIETLNIKEGAEQEYPGTCLSYNGVPHEESITIQLLTNRKCTSFGKIFANEIDNPTYCTPASIAVTTDAYKRHQNGGAIKIVLYRGAAYIIHQKNSLATLEESIYCSYPVPQD